MWQTSLNDLKANVYTHGKLIIKIEIGYLLPT